MIDVLKVCIFTFHSNSLNVGLLVILYPSLNVFSHFSYFCLITLASHSHFLSSVLFVLIIHLQFFVNVCKFHCEDSQYYYGLKVLVLFVLFTVFGINLLFIVVCTVYCCCMYTLYTAVVVFKLLYKYS